MKLLTTAEVATRFGVTTQTVRNWVEAGQLRPHLRTPGTGAYLFDVRKVDRFAQDRAAKS